MFFRVSVKQREMLLQFLERFPPLALGTMRGKVEFETTKLLWHKIARQLNKVEPKVVKSGRNWSKYWADIKFKVRRKVAAVQESRRLGRPGPELSEFEERVWILLTKDIKIGANDEKSNVKDSSMNSIEEVDDCVTIDYDEDGEEVVIHTEYINMEESHITPDNELPQNTNPEPSKATSMNTSSRSTEDVKKELLAFQLQKQKELFLIEKEQRIQRHKLEMEILYLRKETMEKQLKKIWK